MNRFCAATLLGFSFLLIGCKEQAAEVSTRKIDTEPIKHTPSLAEKKVLCVESIVSELKQDFEQKNGTGVTYEVKSDGFELSGLAPDQDRVMRNAYHASGVLWPIKNNHYAGNLVYQYQCLFDTNGLLISRENLLR